MTQVPCNKANNSAVTGITIKSMEHKNLCTFVYMIYVYLVFHYKNIYHKLSMCFALCIYVYLKDLGALNIHAVGGTTIKGCALNFCIKNDHMQSQF